MKIFIASDHGGYKLKETLIQFLTEKGHTVNNLGTNSEEAVDYPDYAQNLCKELNKNPNSYGILICGTGIGMSIAANKRKGIRAALCNETTAAKLSKEHNNANVLCLGGRIIGEELAKAIVETWLKTPFSKEERHVRRINKLGDN